MDDKDSRPACGAHEFLAETLKAINAKLDNVLDKLGEDYASIEVLKTRVTLIEKLVYGAVAASGGAIIIAVLNLVIRKTP